MLATIAVKYRVFHLKLVNFFLPCIALTASTTFQENLSYPQFSSSTFC